MRQSKDEKNKKTRESRFSRCQLNRANRIAAVGYLYRKALDKYLSHAELLEEKERIVGGLEHFPNWVREGVDGAWDLMMNLLYQELVFCYAHPVTGEVTESIELVDSGIAAQIDTKTGGHYYETPQGYKLFFSGP